MWLWRTPHGDANPRHPREASPSIMSMRGALPPDDKRRIGERPDGAGRVVACQLGRPLGSCSVHSDHAAERQVPMGLFSRWTRKPPPPSGDAVHRLVRDCTRWADKRFPPSQEDFPNVPPADEGRWAAWAAAGGAKVALLILEAEGRPGLAEVAWAISEGLATWRPEAGPAFLECDALVEDYINHAMLSVGAKERADLPFALGMCMWKGVYGRLPKAEEGDDMYFLGRFLRASFSGYWSEGVRHVVITGNRS